MILHFNNFYVTIQLVTFFKYKKTVANKPMTKILNLLGQIEVNKDFIIITGECREDILKKNVPSYIQKHLPQKMQDYLSNWAILRTSFVWDYLKFAINKKDKMCSIYTTWDKKIGLSIIDELLAKSAPQPSELHKLGITESLFNIIKKALFKVCQYYGVYVFEVDLKDLIVKNKSYLHRFPRGNLFCLRADCYERTSHLARMDVKGLILQAIERKKMREGFLPEQALSKEIYNEDFQKIKEKLQSKNFKVIDKYCTPLVSISEIKKIIYDITFPQIPCPICSKFFKKDRKNRPTCGSVVCKNKKLRFKRQVAKDLNIKNRSNFTQQDILTALKERINKKIKWHKNRNHQDEITKIKKYDINRLAEIIYQELKQDLSIKQ